MPSRSDAMRRAITTIVVVVVSWCAPAPAAAQRESAQPVRQEPSPADIARALEKVKADPNLATERTIKTLRWNAAETKSSWRTPRWLTWVTGLFRWLGESLRLLTWAAAVALAALLVFFIGRLARTQGAAASAARFIPPTHVRDLDIRPEALPADIGAAARERWDRGEHRSALALLYRGLLSRLVHVHRVPIRDSTTEGDCLALAATHLSQQPRDYASQLVGVWQRAVYGRQEAQATAVYALCDGFASALDQPSSGAPSVAGGGS